jgi:hypothetical protein
VAWFLGKIIENIVFRSINYVIEESGYGQNASNTGMLLFPFGNLSHTSILYYTTLCAEVEYIISKKMMTITLTIFGATNTFASLNIGIIVSVLLLTCYARETRNTEIWKKNIQKKEVII